MAKKPWEHAKQSGSEHDELAARFVESLSYDTRLYKHDIAGSIAHARMLQHVGLISGEDLKAIEQGLAAIEAEIDEQGDGWPGWKVELEDVHMCIEAALIEKVGEPGKKLHTGRSRNDQVATDLLLWQNDASAILEAHIETLIEAFVGLCDRDGGAVMPSYTHLQRAQPIVVGGELLAWCAAFSEDKDRLYRLVGTRCPTRLPLGSGAIAGSSLPLDPVLTCQTLLGGLGVKVFDQPPINSIYHTGNRDEALDFVYALTMLSMHLSRWAEQWIIYMTSEFGFLSIGDAYTTGSSMMPQKRNPDMLELIRGRCGNVYGHLMALLTMCKGITIGYNRDLQEDKRHVFAAHDTVVDCLDMAARIVRSAKFNADRIKQGLDRGFLDATSLAEYLVTKGVSFRTAHQHVGALVNHCIEQNIEKLAALTCDQMNRIAGTDKIGDDVFEWLGPENVVKRYQTYGNAGLTGFEQQLAEWKQRLGDDTADRAEQAEQAEQAGSASGALFGDDGPADDDAALIAAYKAQQRTLDDLPYTDQFEAIATACANDDRAALFHRLHNLRKAGKLPSGFKAWEKPPVVTPEQATMLQDLVEQKVGKLSLRDQLPYTEGFADLCETFNARAGLQFTPYQIWRVVAKLAK